MEDEDFGQEYDEDSVSLFVFHLVCYVGNMMCQCFEQCKLNDLNHIKCVWFLCLKLRRASKRHLNLHLI